MENKSARDNLYSMMSVFPLSRKHSANSLLSVSKSNLILSNQTPFEVDSIPKLTLDTIDRMQQLRNKFPTIGYANKTQKISSNAFMDRETRNQNGQNTDDEDTQKYKDRLSKRNKQIDFRAVVKLQKNRILPELNEIRKINNESSQISSKMSYTSQSRFLQMDRNKSMGNLPELMSLPSNLMKNLQLTQLLNTVGEQREELMSASPKFRTPQQQSVSQVTSPFFKSKKQKRLEQTYKHIDFFLSDDSFNIILPKLSSIKVASLDNFDETQQLYDSDPLTKFEFGPFLAHSKWTNLDGTVEWTECLVKSYNPETKMFLIQWLKNASIQKFVTRLNLIYDSESIEQSQKRFEMAKRKRDQLINFIQIKQSIDQLESPPITFKKLTMNNILSKQNKLEKSGNKHINE